MPYKIETHCHTSEVSSCGRLPGSQIAEGYMLAGYSASVVTDHIGADRFALGRRYLPDRVDMYLQGWREAKKEGDKWGLNVLLGAEARLISGDEDFLIFGLAEEDIGPLMLLLDSRPDIYAFSAAVRARGWMIVQAHPCRPGLKTGPPETLDGVEVYNGNPRHDSRNALALAFAREHGLLMTSGSDAHHFMDVARGGLLSPEEIANNDQLLAFLRRDKRPERIETLTGFVKKQSV